MQHKILKKILEFKKKKEKEKRKKGTRWESTPKVAWNTKPVEEIPTNFFFNQAKHNNTLKQLHKSKQN